MLGEKRNQSLFAPKSSEVPAVTQITTGPDGQKKELPLYFGPDCPVSGGINQNQRMNCCVTTRPMMGQGLNLIPQIAWIWRRISPGVP